MADFSSIGGTAAHTGKIDFSTIGGVPMVGGDEPMDDTTALGAAGRGATSMIPLGNQAYSAIAGAVEKEPYLQERQELEKEVEADRANHPIARVAGQAAGIIAPAVLTGGALAPESLLGAAGQGAAMGAGFGAGNAIDTLAGGGSGAKAAGEVALGAGMGAAGGAAGYGLGKLLAKPATSLENVGVEKAGQAMGLSPTELGNMSEPEFANFQQFVKDQGLLGKTPQEMLDKASEVQTTFGDKIKEIRNQSREMGLSTDIKPITDKLGPKYLAASELHNPDEVAAANFYKKGMADILAMASKNPVAEGEVPTQITFDQLQRLKTSYGHSAFENGAVKSPAAADVYGAVKGGLQQIVDDAQGNPNLGQEYKTALKGYTQISPIVEGLEQRVGLARSGGGGGNVASNLAQAAMMASMGRGSFAARQAARAGFAMSPETVARGANAIAGKLGTTGAALPMAGAQIGGASAPTPSLAPTTDIQTLLNHPALAKYKPDFAKNAAPAKSPAEVQTSLTRTDFVKSQSDPAYAAAKQEAVDKPIQPSGNSGELSTESSNGLPNKTQSMAEGGVVPQKGFPTMAEKLREYLIKQKGGDSAQSR